MNAPARIFTPHLATRESVPLFIGLIGPSSSGKTFSALRLATGIQKVNGGDIHMIDTENRQVIEFTNDEIEALQRAVARRLGYELTGHRLELYGVPLGAKSAVTAASDGAPARRPRGRPA